MMLYDFGALNLLFSLSVPTISYNSHTIIVSFSFYPSCPTPFAALLFQDKAHWQHTRNTCSAHARPQRFACDYCTRTAQRGLRTVVVRELYVNCACAGAMIIYFVSFFRSESQVHFERDNRTTTGTLIRVL